MRKRSSALHADNEDEYKSKMKIIAECSENKKAVVNVYNPSTQGATVNIPDSLVIRKKASYEAGTSEFTFPEGETSARKGGWNEVHFEDTYKSDITEEENNFISEKSTEIMMCGALNVGKHYLINTAFDDAQGECKTDSKFDMTVRTSKTNGSKRTYKIWSLELGSDNIEPIVSMYYKKINLFVFVFDYANKDSLSALDERIAKIRTQVPAEKFKGILIGNRCSLNYNVSREDAEKLKKQYDLLDIYEVEYGSTENKHLVSKIEQLFI